MTLKHPNPKTYSLIRGLGPQGCECEEVHQARLNLIIFAKALF